MRPRPIHYALGLLCLAVLLGGLVWPMAKMLQRGFFDPSNGQFTWDYLLRAVNGPMTRLGLINALLIAVATTGAVIAIAVPLALIADRYRFAGKTLLTGLLMVPMILPPFVGAIGLRQILARYGGSVNVLLQQIGLLGPGQFIDWFGRWRVAGIVVLEALHLYPILYLNVAAALANIDPAMNEAAANMGAGRWRRFWKITWPLMMPGLFAGASIVGVWSFTELGTPLMFGYRQHLAVQIFERLNEYESTGMPYAMVTIMLGASVLVYATSKLLLARKGGAAQMPKATIAAGERRLGWAGSMLAAAPFLVVTGLAIIPHIGVVLTSFAGDWFDSVLPQKFTLDHYRDALGHSLTLPSIANSIQYAAGAMLADLVLGLTIAWLIVRVKLPGRRLLDSLAMLPLAVPGLVLAFGYVALSADLHVPLKALAQIEHRTLLQQIQFSLLSLADVEGNPMLLLIVAYAIRRLPYVVRSAAAGLEQSPVVLEEAAANMGASPSRVLRRITVPLIAASLMAGALLAFAFSMLEVSDSLVLARRAENYPITKAIYELWGRLGNGQFIASALGVWAMALLIVTILTTNRLLGRRLGAVFRM